MLQTPPALRPTTLRVLDALHLAGDRALGQTFDVLAAQLGVAERSIRRALRELESESYVRCARTSDRRKYVVAVTTDVRCGPVHMRVSAFKTAHERPSNGPVTAHERPMNGPVTAQVQAPQSSIELLFKRTSSSGESRVDRKQRETTPPPPPPQQLLGLEGTDDADDRARSAQALRRLDKRVGAVWLRLGATHGFLACDDKTLVGLAAAIRRYPWDEIADCVAWSAEEVAAGRLKGVFFATTFRGSAFCRRHSEWQAALQRQQLRAVQAAEPPEPEPERTCMDGELLEQLGAAALLRFGGTS